MRIPAFVLLPILALGFLSAYAQTASTEYGCEAPEVRSAFLTTLSQDELVRLTAKQRAPRIQQTLSALIAKYPHEYLLYREQWNTAVNTEDFEAAIAARRERWVNDAKEHPDDPMARMLAGKALEDKNPEEAIRQFQAAQAIAPGFPWPSFELAHVYSRGKYADQVKLKENLEHFYALCPSWVDETNFGKTMENFKLRADPTLVAKTSVALREELAKQSDPKQLTAYETLWQREFLTRPPSEHDAERAQIRQDLDRVQKLVPQGDAHWRQFLISGYRLAGASNGELDQMQREAAKDFPHQSPAQALESNQWAKEHPRPDGPKDATAWKAYDAANVAHIKQLMRDYPDDAFLQRTELFFTVQDDPYVSEADGVAAVDRYLNAMEVYGPYGILSADPTALPKFLLAHGWQPERALALLRKTSTYKDGGHTKVNWGDSLSPEDVKRFERFRISGDLQTLGLILKAATLAGKPQEAMRFREVIEEPPPEDKKNLEQYWTNRAHFAALDHRAQDALAYYRAAFDARLKPPEYSQGVLKDELATDFHALWVRQGGTETTWAALNLPVPTESANATQPRVAADKPAVAQKDAKSVVTPEGDWEKVTKKMPAIDLSNFSGGQWRQAEGAGKVIVVVSWATWCGPCRLQDALLQKFYDKVKDRKDLALVTLNIDENPGQVLPYMRRAGYTFPVLAAFSYPEAQNLVPRTWIIDKQGSWRWVKNGYDEAKTYAEFENDLLGQISKVQAAP